MAAATCSSGKPSLAFIAVALLSTLLVCLVSGIRSHSSGNAALLRRSQATRMRMQHIRTRMASPSVFSGHMSQFHQGGCRKEIVENTPTFRERWIVNAVQDAEANATASIKPVEPPPLQTQSTGGGNALPFGFYLLGSGLVTIAAVGSFFEIAAKNPAFGVIPADSPLYLPLLGTFALTGLPSAGWLFFKGVQGFNDWQAALDRMDGYDRNKN